MPDNKLPLYQKYESLPEGELRRLAEQDDALAQFMLARKSEGDATAEACAERDMWYRRSAKLGFAPAEWLVKEKARKKL